MAIAIFIGREDVVKNTVMNGNVDTDKFMQFIKLAQQMHIENYLGTKLYNKISAEIIANTLTGDYQFLVHEYVQPMLIHFAMVDYLPFAAYEIKNSGLLKHQSENSLTPTKDEVDFLAQKHRNFAEFYTRRFIDYMSFNAPSKFPEYTTNINDDIYPDKDANFTGWVL
tara:strand:+ start:2980 stop:3483 length:504 start_codon:yes stop_codon:yes gene_type:complete